MSETMTHSIRGNGQHREIETERLIGRDALLEMVPYTIQHIYRREKAGTFPRRVRVGGNRVAWVHSEIVDWMHARMRERDEAEHKIGINAEKGIG